MELWFHGVLPSDFPLTDPASRDFETLRAVLRAKGPAMPKRLRQVAAFVLEHSEDFAFATAAQVAAAAHVQPSTLVRFAKAIGYAGFSDLQDVFRSRLKQGFPDYRDRLQALRGGGGPLALFDGFAKAAEVSLQRARATLTPEALARAVAVLGGAKTVYLMGARRVYPIASALFYAFSKLDVAAFLIDNHGGMAPEQAMTATAHDALLVVSFAPYAPVSIETAKLARARGVPVVAITDSPFSPLVPLADVWLELAEADYGAFRSLAATQALAMTLAVAAAEARG